jgi:putative addiction module component (TIGR02574 family)
MADLLDSIFKLSKVEQITLVQLILDNVAVSEEEDTNSWLTVEVKEELERRSMAIKDGTTQLHSWEAVQNSINEKHGFDITV